MPDWGYPLDKESWLDNSFDEIKLGAHGPPEFRDVEWETLPPEAIVNAQETFEWLKSRRRRPMSLKSSARLAIRSTIISNKRSSVNVCSHSLLHRLDTIMLPKSLIDYVSFSNILTSV